MEPELSPIFEKYNIADCVTSEGFAQTEVANEQTIKKINKRNEFLKKHQQAVLKVYNELTEVPIIHILVGDIII